MTQQQILVERFFETLISGDRRAARSIVDQCFAAEVEAEQIIERLIWPTYEHIENQYRSDTLSRLSHHYATRLLRMIVDQVQLRLHQSETLHQRVLVVCGPDEPNELAGQMAADLLEAAGYDVYFAGGGVAKDEIIAQLGELDPQTLVMFSSVPSDLPEMRVMIDEIHDHGLSPRVQIVVGGGVFNRADGLAEEIGADLWAASPLELVQELKENSERRADDEQRTVGRRRRAGSDSTVAAA